VLSVAAVLSASAIVASQSALATPQFTDVYVSGEAGYHTFRIPSVIATQNGTLLAFAEGRRVGASDAGDIDLVVKRSRDGGRSWSPLQVVGDNGANTFGNPCPVLDRKTGALWLLSTHNRGTDREKDIVAGTSQESRTVWAMKTLDDGETWSAPVEITASVKRPDWTWYATGPGIGIQTRGGRLVIPANHAEAGSGVHRSHIIYSDDGGGHWSLGGSADAGTNESQIIELTDGRLMLNMRNHPPKPENFRMVAISDDLGRTFSKASPDRALIEPPAQASLLRLTSVKTADRNRLLFANPASTARERLTVRLSYDEGVTWPIARVVHEGPAAYSSLVALQDSSVGLLFERGDRSPYERITFARFTIEWLTDGRDHPATSDIVSLPDVPDPHGFAGAFAGISNGHLLAGGGAIFPDGVMPWDGSQKVWHDRVFALDLRVHDAQWREIGRLPAPNAYGVSLTIPEGVLIIGGAASPAPVGAGSLFVVSGDDGTQSGLASPANHSGFTRDILRYEPGDDRWYRTGVLSVPPPVTVPTAPWQDNYIFFSGERRPGVRSTQVFRFHPGR
jgi:sialidase-1